MLLLKGKIDDKEIKKALEHPNLPDPNKMPFDYIQVFDVTPLMKTRITEGNYTLNLCSDYGMENILDQYWYGIEGGCDCRGHSKKNLRAPDGFVKINCNMVERVSGCVNT